MITKLEASTRPRRPIWISRFGLGVPLPHSRARRGEPSVGCFADCVRRDTHARGNMSAASRPPRPPSRHFDASDAPEDFSSLTRWTTTNGDMQFNPAEHSDPSWRPDHLDDPIAERARRRSQIAEPAGTGEFAVGGWAGVPRMRLGGPIPSAGRIGAAPAWSGAPRTSSGRWASLWWWTRPRRLRRSRTATAAPWRTCWRRWRGIVERERIFERRAEAVGAAACIRAAGGRAPAARTW